MLALAILSILLFSFFTGFYQLGRGIITESVTIGSTGTIQQAPATGMALTVNGSNLLNSAGQIVQLRDVGL